jgi:hypothetical protein
MTAIVGNAPGYEEAIRALYAGQREEFIRPYRSLAGRYARQAGKPGRRRF